MRTSARSRNTGSAYLGLALWACPIALIPVLLRARSLDDDARFSRSRAHRTMLTLATVPSAILLGFALVAIVMLGSAVPLWLAGAVLLLSTAVPALVLAIAQREPRSLAVFWAETGGVMDLHRSLTGTHRVPAPPIP